MTSTSTNAPPPIPEFRDADHYWGPGHGVVAGAGHEIIRPKPRRPGDMHRLSAGDVALLYKNGIRSDGVGGPASQAPNVYSPQPLPSTPSSSTPSNALNSTYPSHLASPSSVTNSTTPFGSQPLTHKVPGSTPVVLRSPAREILMHQQSSSSTTPSGTGQVFRTSRPSSESGFASPSAASQLITRSCSRERLVGNQMFSLPAQPPTAALAHLSHSSHNSSSSSITSSNRELMSRDAKDAWDYYGSPNATTPFHTAATAARRDSSPIKMSTPTTQLPPGHDSHLYKTVSTTFHRDKIVPGAAAGQRQSPAGMTAAPFKDMRLSGTNSGQQQPGCNTHSPLPSSYNNLRPNKSHLPPPSSARPPNAFNPVPSAPSARGPLPPASFPASVIPPTTSTAAPPALSPGDNLCLPGQVTHKGELRVPVPVQQQQHGLSHQPLVHHHHLHQQQQHHQTQPQSQHRDREPSAGPETSTAADLLPAHGNNQHGTQATQAQVHPHPALPSAAPLPASNTSLARPTRSNESNNSLVPVPESPASQSAASVALSSLSSPVTLTGSLHGTPPTPGKLEFGIETSDQVPAETAHEQDDSLRLSSSNVSAVLAVPVSPESPEELSKLEMQTLQSPDSYCLRSDTLHSQSSCSNTSTTSTTATAIGTGITVLDKSEKEHEPQPYLHTAPHSNIAIAKGLSDSSSALEASSDPSPLPRSLTTLSSSPASSLTGRQQPGSSSAQAGPQVPSRATCELTLPTPDSTLLSSVSSSDGKNRRATFLDSASRHLSHVHEGHATPESTDCGSLSKSSSDGDPIGVVSRKRPPTKLKSRRRNILSFPHHLSVDELRVLQRRQDSYGGSSSDENRSSGHASMSDGHTSSSPPAETLPRHTHYRIGLNAVPEDERLSASVTSQPTQPSSKHSRRNLTPSKSSRHRLPAKDELSLQLENATGLEDIKMAIEQLTLRSHGSRTSYSTSTYSSLSGSEGGEPLRRLIRHSSLETINTNVTIADEFVWVDSYNRLVELQHLPWSNHDVLKVIQNGRVKEHLERVSMETVPRLSYLLQRALVRVAREAQRLARPLGMCSKQEICSALRIVLSPFLADSCIKACLRAAAMYTVSGDLVRQSKSARAGLHLSVGRFQRWMCDVRLGRFIHDYAAVYLAAGLENLLEEIVLQSLPTDQETLLTASVLEHAIANNGDLWGLLQPYAHLNAGRTATGALALPRWPSQSSLDSIRSSSTLALPVMDDHSRSAKTLEQSLLTTCVGSLQELSELLNRVSMFHFKHVAPSPGTGTPASGRQPLCWAGSALHALFYFMRCSQLEHAEHAQRAPIQELVYERPYIVLPPLVEWVRVAAAHAEHRHSCTVDRDDVSQAARILLPGVDCPVRTVGFEEIICPKRQMDEVECSRKLKVDLAFKMLGAGRSDLIPHALQLMPSSKINTVNEAGFTPLMLAAIQSEESLVQMLLDAGADVDAETPSSGPETQHWTALTYAAIHGHLSLAKMLLERGAQVEGGARLSEDKLTHTPLQVAAGAGNLDMINLLLSHGARPFLSTIVRDSLCYSGSAQKGCYSAIAVAAAHGQRSVLHKLLSHPLNMGSNSEVLSLEEILAEGASNFTSDRRPHRNHGTDDNSNREKPQPVKLSKVQIKALQEAMYHSAENAHLEITLDLRGLGVPWTLHCWMHTLATAHEHSLESVIDQLLQDFLQVWPDDCSTQFVDECLPLLFNIFRYSKNEGTTLLLADIFATCYGREAIKEIRDTTLSGGPRIDPKFVNNPELSDVQFRVEGRVFYAHKIILITASPRFKAMLNSKFCEGNPPIIQINDIRYDIFQMVMHYLYKGGCENLEVDQNDVLELMAAANFFQLDGLLRFCESRCSTLVDLDNIVSMYIHAKVYNAVQLLEFCQGFLLQNMVALLTYDDSVRRLIFGKKLHNHDVLAGLLLTLQARIKSRSTHKGK